MLDPAEDYRVFVHFLDERAQVLWTEDHDPPVPTSEWTPGAVHRILAAREDSHVPVYRRVGNRDGPLFPA